MKLSSLHLHGFKSFPDRTKLDFRDGVTAIIGSNGCGKSNIADSIRWVLGEQRASAIRGSKMEEAIFQGTTRRRPLNFAEVSLIFDNEDGRVAVPQREIEVSRKGFREGGSEYLLNRNACRLKDIQNLLRDTGLGSNAYAVIEAGMIETLLSDRAEERRMLFEEAAGVSRYKDNRKAALRRLEQAEADLARLEDLIGEVQSKVRSLSRQARRVERHQELRDRRLALEVALAKREIADLTKALEQGEKRHGELGQEQRSAAAERSTAEAQFEERRIEHSRLTKERTQVAARLDAVRQTLDAREREVMLADERRAHAEQRIQQLVAEREQLAANVESLREARSAAAAERERHTGVVQAMRLRLEEQSDSNAEVRRLLTAERESAETVAARSRELAHEIATLEGQRVSAERRRADAKERLIRLQERDEQLRTELSSAAEQTELWTSKSDELRERVDAAESALQRTHEEMRVLRSREQEARAALREAEDTLSQLTATIAARETLERSYEGFAPAVAALMSERERFPGIHGPLADFIRIDERGGAEAEGVERYLGATLQALIVDDLATARDVRLWFRDEWDGGGALLLLPLDAPGLESAQPAAEALPVRAVGEGSRWLDALLQGLVVVGDDPLRTHQAGGTRVGPGGDIVDRRGVVRLREADEAEGILARRDALEKLRRDWADALEARDTAAGRREHLLEQIQHAEARAREAEEQRRSAESDLRRVESDSASHLHRHSRLERELEEVAEQLATYSKIGEDSAEQLLELQQRLEAATSEVERANTESAEARGRLGELEARWEEARDQEAELRVSAARAEADLREAEHRLAAADSGITSAEQRGAAIEKEALELRDALAGLSGLSERAGEQIEELFRERDRESAALAALDERFAAVDEEMAAAEDRARGARRTEASGSEERHRLELRLAELRSNLERARERLEVEWGRPWEFLQESASPVEDATADEWMMQLKEVARQLDSLGPVNMLAVEEHEEEQQRLEFLSGQRDDLVQARDDLVSAVRQINRTAREVFMETFDQVRENFRRTFQSLFQGGECDVWLEDADDPLESPIEIQASPKGKKTQRIHLLSGGERTLTALALLFALYLVKPSPFCVLDEVDAPLDESNVGRFIKLLEDFKSETQFIVITHNPRTMEAADWLYGVTMEEPGVSSIVGVEMLGAFEYEPA